MALFSKKTQRLAGDAAKHLSDFQGIIQDIFDGLDVLVDSKSDTWQESEAGETANRVHEGLETILEQIDDWFGTIHEIAGEE